jgi:hypothetical protein
VNDKLPNSVTFAPAFARLNYGQSPYSANGLDSRFRGNDIKRTKTFFGALS